MIKKKKQNQRRYEDTDIRRTLAPPTRLGNQTARPFIEKRGFHVRMPHMKEKFRHFGKRGRNRHHKIVSGRSLQRQRFLDDEQKGYALIALTSIHRITYVNQSSSTYNR